MLKLAVVLLWVYNALGHLFDTRPGLQSFAKALDDSKEWVIYLLPSGGYSDFCNLDLISLVLEKSKRHKFLFCSSNFSCLFNLLKDISCLKRHLLLGQGPSQEDFQGLFQFYSVWIELINVIRTGQSSSFFFIFHFFLLLLFF